MLRDLRGSELIEKAVLYGAVKHGEEFYFVVKEKKDKGNTAERQPSP